MRISDWSSDVCSSDLDLAMQASTGTLSDDDRALVQKEVAALTSQIGDVATRTTFNGTSLLNGTTDLDGAGAGTAVGTVVSIQTGLNDGDVVDIAIADLQAAALGVDALDFSSAAGASGALTTLDKIGRAHV